MKAIKENKGVGYGYRHGLGLVLLLSGCVLLFSLTTGCARYNTFYNAKKFFDDAEHVRDERIRKREDATKPTTGQVGDYQKAIKKCQYLLEEYPGHSLTDDALFLMAKSYHRIQSYRMSISRLELLFQNFPANKFMEEALFLQAVNYMFIGNAAASNNFLSQLNRSFPGSRFQAEAQRLSGDNAYALEKWPEASEDYRDYLDDVAEDLETGDVEYKLAQCHWKMNEYDEAGALLQKESSVTEDKAVQLDKKLLLARCLLRRGRFEEAEAILDASDEDAGLYGKSGMVLMVRAENLVAQGREKEATPLIENISDEWRTQDVAARLGEILGNIYLDAWRLEDARMQFRATVRNIKILEDPDRSRLINSGLDTYLKMEQRLDSASPEQAPSLKLVQANILLGVLEEPRRALDIYLDLTRTVELDSASAVRGLYGATIVYRDYLDLPDSASRMADRLLEEFPDSPQAFRLDPDREGELFDYLMDQQAVSLALALSAAADTNSSMGSEVSDQAVAEVPGQVRELSPRTTPDDPNTGRRRYHRRPKGRR